MTLPFDAGQFFGVFVRYNETVWPVQLVLIAVAIAIVALIARPSPARDRVTSSLLALLWLWMGIVYHIGFFRAINPAAALFGLAFILEGLALLVIGAGRGRLHFRLEATARGVASSAFLAFALVVYPAIGFFAGHRYPAAPTFGLPCPTTIFTLGVLLTIRPRVSALLLIVPLSWSLLGVSAAWQFGVWGDLALPVAGAATAWLWLRSEQRRPVPAFLGAWL